MGNYFPLNCVKFNRTTTISKRCTNLPTVERYFLIH